MAFSPDPIPAERVRPLKRREYERLVELGSLKDEKVELLYGRIIRMSPQGGPHRYSVERLVALLVVGLRGRARLTVQSSFAASDESEPEPDLGVVPLGDYLDAPPAKAYLVIEVAQSSLPDDRRKAALYSAAGVSEYWIVNLVDSVIEVHRHPSPSGYAQITQHGRGKELPLPSFEDVIVRVSDVIPPRG
jgi:Uma2 family endonuclease